MVRRIHQASLVAVGVDHVHRSHVVDDVIGQLFARPALFPFIPVEKSMCVRGRKDEGGRRECTGWRIYKLIYSALTGV